MITVSDRAKALLLERKRHADISDPAIGLRIAKGSRGRWILVADRPRSGDQVVEHAGVTVLLIGPDVQRSLAGTALDCVETSEGAGLALTLAGTQNGHRWA